MTATRQLDHAGGTRRLLIALLLSVVVCVGPGVTAASAAGVRVEFIDGPADGAVFRQGATIKVVLRARSSSPLSEVTLTVRAQDARANGSVERRIAWPYDPQQRMLDDVVAGELTLIPREDKTFEILASARSGSDTASATRAITVTPRGTHTANPEVGMRKIETSASSDGAGKPYSTPAPDQRATSGATPDEDTGGAPLVLVGGGALLALVVGGAVVVRKRR